MGSLTFTSLTVEPALTAEFSVAPALSLAGISVKPALSMASVYWNETMFADAETPQGEIDGENTEFVLAFPPNPPASLMLFENGLVQNEGEDYELIQNVIVFAFAPEPDTTLLAWYRH